MEKLLSIAIPSYNMEAYLNRCLDSLLVGDELMGTLDIIIVNDGSKDRTTEIAHQYAERFPASISVIDKENGHYGSCINAALKVSAGKYFKILDADDWYDTEALISFINRLYYASEDVICTDFTIHKEKKLEVHSLKNVLYEQTIDLNSELIPCQWFDMHSLCFKTCLLRQIGYYQTEGVSYTDQEYSLYPLMKANSLIYINCNLYQYFIGREEQSVSISSYIKNRKDFFPIVRRMLKHMKSDEPGNLNSSNLLQFYLKINLTRRLLPLCLFMGVRDSESSKLLGSILSDIKNLSIPTYKDITSERYHGLYFYRIWYKMPKVGNVLISIIKSRWGGYPFK